MNQVLDIFAISAQPQQAANNATPTTSAPSTALFGSLLAEALQPAMATPVDPLTGIPIGDAEMTAMSLVEALPSAEESTATSALSTQSTPGPVLVDETSISQAQDLLTAQLLGLLGGVESSTNGYDSNTPSRMIPATHDLLPESSIPPALLSPQQIAAFAKSEVLKVQIPSLQTDASSESMLPQAASRPNLPTTIAFVDTPVATIDKLTALLASQRRGDVIVESVEVNAGKIPEQPGTFGVEMVGGKNSILSKNAATIKIDHFSGQLDYDVRISELHNKTVVRPEMFASNSEGHISGSGLVERAALPLAIMPTRLTNAPSRTSQTVQPTEDRELPVSSEFEASVEIEADPSLIKPVNQQGALSPIIDADDFHGFAKDHSLTGGLVDSMPKIPKSELDAKTAELHSQRVELPESVKLQTSIKRLHIEALLKRGEIKIQLQPEHLGTLKIKLVSAHNELTARLETSSDDARRAVEISLPQLRENFERAGLKLSHIEIISNNDNLARQSQEFARNLKQPRKPQTTKVAAAAAATPIVGTLTTGGGIGNRPGLNLLA